MGELLTDLYEDLLEFGEDLDSTAVRDATTTAVSVQEADANSRVQGSQIPEPADWQGASKKPQRLMPSRPVQQVKSTLEHGGDNPSSSRKLKYFIMKSNNSTNIDRSLATGVWSTQHHNEAKLTEAFLGNYEIRLIFSINQSGHFQGYAVMKSGIGRGPKHNIWVGSAWGGFFEIDWQLQYDFPFSRFEHLSNPLNEGKPVKFARDGQEVPAEVGSEMTRIMHEIARVNGVGKPVIPNQLKVEPYPDGRAAGSMDRRDFDPDRRGRGDGQRGGRGHRWGSSYYGRYNGAYNRSYPYASSNYAVNSYSPGWSGSGYYQRNYPPTEYPPRAGYGGWPQGPSTGQKRPRSLTPPLADCRADKPSLYEMTYEEYLECYERVQNRVQEIITTGELWKALGMIPEDYAWGEDDQKKINESGWFDAWFGDLVKNKHPNEAQGEGSPKQDEGEVESSSGSRVMTENEFVDFCRKFCGDVMHFDEDKIKAYYQKMDSVKDIVVPIETKKLRLI